MSELKISGLSASVGDKHILKDLSLTIRSGEIHALMGPNGSGKSTLSNVLLAKPGYQVTGGSVMLDGEEVLDMPTWRRAATGIFLAMQYPTEIPGVSLQQLLLASTSPTKTKVDVEAVLIEADKVGLDPTLLERPVNVDLSGGEKKRNETLQLALLGAKFAILDELDSGLDVDALDQVARRVYELCKADSSGSSLPGALIITHYARILEILKPDFVHVFVDGRIVRSGDAELVHELERTGYGAYANVAS